MGFYRKLVAHCDGHEPYDASSRCPSSQVLKAESTQPYHELLAAGWSLSTDGAKIYCPKTHKEDEK